MKKPLSRKRKQAILEMMKQVVVKGSEVDPSMTGFVDELRQVEQMVFDRLMQSSEQLVEIIALLEQVSATEQLIQALKKVRETLDDSAAGHMFIFKLIDKMTGEIYTWRTLDKIRKAAKPAAKNHPKARKVVQ